MNSSHNWLKSYLSNRSFSVTFGSTSSSILSSSSGVPQGSVLGPILFTIYVSPIAWIVFSHDVNQQQYADDTQLFLFISPESLSSSLCSLQRCISSLQSLVLINGLVLNPTKTEAICLGTNPRLSASSVVLQDSKSLMKGQNLKWEDKATHQTRTDGKHNQRNENEMYGASLKDLKNW